MFDILIKNATVVDGTGKPGFQADVGIKQNKIAKVGKISLSRGKIEIDARDKVVSPGFIDIHNHSDSYWQIFLEPQLPSLLYQGVTTIIGGNCGASIAPLTDGKIIEAIQKWVDIKRVNVDWLTLQELRDKMKGKKIATNFATLVGHGTLRRGVIQNEMRRLDLNELEEVIKLLDRSLQEGALGLSSGLAYSHEKSATWDELVELAEVVKSHERVYTTHLRDEADGIVSSIKETIDLANQTGVNVEISHFKIIGEKNWPLLDEALGMIEKTRASGININFDVYPYTEIGSVLYIYLPGWAAEGGKKALLRRLKDKSLRKKIIDEMKNTSSYHYEDAIIAVCSFSRAFAGRKISAIAAERGVSPEEVILDILSASEGRVITLMDCLDEENVKKLIAHPLSMIASDGIGYSIFHKNSGELVHPRCFGTFPRILGKYVREEKLLKLEDAIKKMTSLPAEKFGLENRGKINKGLSADLVIFDQNLIKDKATLENPYQYSEGIEHVIVNGKFAMQDGKLTGEMAGEFITA